MDKNLLRKIGDTLLSSPFSAFINMNPDKLSPVLYKYRNWKDDNHKNMLRQNEVYMSPPGKLNDPFDCRIYENHLKFVNTEKRKEEYILKSLKEHSDYFIKKNISETEAREILTERLKDTLHYQVRSEVLRNEFDDKHYGILCLSENWESILMWTHYADDHKGYCIGFEQKWICLPSLFGKVKRVNYSEEYPEIDPLNKDKNSWELQYFHKSLDWKYESEVRALNLFSEENTENQSRIVVLENKYIKEIVLGLNTSETDKKEIIAIAKDKNIDIYQTMKAEFEFKIERYKL